MTTQAKERLPLEEVANCATHGVGLALSMAGFVALVALAWAYGDAWHIASCGVYGASLVALSPASTLYHGARRPRAKQLFQALDHCGIYLLIAGTYTPFTLVTLRGPWGGTLFGLGWGLPLLGLLFRAVCAERYRPVPVASYVLLGWLCVVAVKPILALVPLGA